MKSSKKSLHSILPLLVPGTGIALLILIFATDAFAEAAEPWKGAYTAGPFAGGVLRDAYCDLVSLIEGNMGGLLATVAAVIAIAAAAFGRFERGFSFIMVAIGTFTLSAGVSLYFGDLGCSARNNNNAAQTLPATGGQAAEVTAPGTMLARERLLEATAMHSENPSQEGSSKELNKDVADLADSF